MRVIEESELIINKDGSIFHLHLLPEDIADTIIMVGDPGRVKTVAGFFDKKRLEKQNREFYTITGEYKGKPISVISTGIGTDNIDIVVNELDALVNIDFNSRTVKEHKKSLNLIRLGTSGAIQPDIPVDSYVASEISIGFDGLLNYYSGRNLISMHNYENAFIEKINWPQKLAIPYFVRNSDKLLNIFASEYRKGMTISAPGFYGPQGRELRLDIIDKEMNSKLERFSYGNKQILNYEMESSAIAGLGNLLGHQTLTICAIIANRSAKKYSKDYKPVVKELIYNTLENINKL